MAYPVGASNEDWGSRLAALGSSYSGSIEAVAVCSS